MLPSVPSNINKCPIHNTWIKKTGDKRWDNLYRYCPVCLTQDMAKRKAQVEDNNDKPVHPIKIITL